MMVDAPLSPRSQAPDPRDPGYERLLSLLELADRGSRELDLAIDRVVRPEEYVPRPRRDGPEPPPDFGTDALSMEMHSAPRYSLSLDAALTLVPGKAHWSVSWPVGEAELVYGDGRVIEANAATAPLALCIAALKARHTEPPQ